MSTWWTIFLLLEPLALPVVPFFVHRKIKAANPCGTAA
jgi:hypothetical protein